ncbi:MAG: aminotransferase class IV [Hyphomicrobiales bacterium]
MKRIWHKGALAGETIAISPFDRGLTLGDGLFETLLVLNGVALDAPEHVERLKAGAAELGIVFPEPEITASISALSEGVKSHHVLRLTLTRGSAGRGLATDTDDYTYLATLQPANAALMFQPMEFALGSVCRNETSPAARLKTTSYMDAIMAAREVQAETSAEPLMCNTHGKLASASIGNIFLCFGQTLVTPSRDQGILPGIMRQKVIGLSGKAGFTVEERPVEPHELERADGVFLTNALRFLCPSRRHGRTDFTSLIEPLCAAAKAACGVDPRRISKE